ncbi:hypothetical protein C8N46_105337 [Kordia periserrulae]|uniref:Uncharacterized protein n=1 Tax=Kordia periserrulae TaxID=701523 RepID=A0A2T6BYK8_9FLAO|nr:hypothetical protein [Kordia periserrulae]PTX61180.1 hypothetical protein C8N46_105337 [Kordia periserrulae]
MKTKNVKSLALRKTAISQLNAEKVTGGLAAPTTHKTNITCGGICENSVVVCEK